MIDKNKLKQKLIALENNELRYAKGNYAQYLADAKIDRSRAIDDQDRSQAEQNSKLAAKFECPIHTHEQTLKRISVLDFGPKTVVEPGALVKFAGKYFVIATATSVFECQGHKIMGISPEAPIYKYLEGLEEGESFDFNEKTQTLELVR